VCLTGGGKDDDMSPGKDRTMLGTFGWLLSWRQQRPHRRIRRRQGGRTFLGQLHPHATRAPISTTPEPDLSRRNQEDERSPTLPGAAPSNLRLYYDVRDVGCNTIPAQYVAYKEQRLHPYFQLCNSECQRSMPAPHACEVLLARLGVGRPLENRQSLSQSRPPTSSLATRCWWRWRRSRSTRSRTRTPLDRSRPKGSAMVLPPDDPGGRGRTARRGRSQ
jgi:hypothetical protein